MSRTDKDRPWKIRAADRTDVRRKNPAYFSHDEWAHIRTGECGAWCCWTLPHYSFVSPPRDYIHAVWSGPERAREQRYLRRLAQEYNSNGDLIDGDFENRQHRHCAKWLWW